MMCLGLFHPGRIEPDEEESITVTVVQSEDCILESYVKLTRTAKGEFPGLIVWPEYSLPYDVRENKGRFSILKNLCSEMDAVLVVGTKTIVGSGDKDWSLRTLQVKLIKIGAKVVRHSRYVIFQMAEVMVSKSLFHEILGRISRLKPVPIGFG